MEPLLLVEDLTIHSPKATLVDGVSFQVAPGRCLAFVGESGSGKSLTALSLLNLLPQGLRRKAKKIVFDGKRLDILSPEEIHLFRGREMTIIFQDAQNALNPLMRVGRQVAEMRVIHKGETWKEAKEKTIAFFDALHIPHPSRVYRAFPHQLSGGMAQRVVIAMALIASPRLVMADEPTTALDVTLQGEILALLKEQQKDQGFALIFITHDLGAAKVLADEILVLYAGKVMEKGSAEALFQKPHHPYTQALMAIYHARRGASSHLPSLEGQVPSPEARPRGCPFYPRCNLREPRCQEGPIPWQEGDTHYACIHPPEKK